jgi:hypothetical protein
MQCWAVQRHLVLLHYEVAIIEGMSRLKRSSFFSDIYYRSASCSVECAWLPLAMALQLPLLQAAPKMAPHAVLWDWHTCWLAIAIVLWIGLMQDWHISA